MAERLLKKKPHKVASRRAQIPAEPDGRAACPHAAVEVFANNDDAVSWIGKQIAEKKETYHLDESAIDDWYVEIDGPLHTIQYDVKECLLN